MIPQRRQHTRGPVLLGELPEGTRGTEATLSLMRTLVEQGGRDPVIRQLAQSIVQRAGVSPRSLAALRALFEWVRDHITFQRDPRALELLSTPRRTLEKGHEDCDGKATLLGALIRALGHPAALAFRVVGQNPLAPRSFSHVYLVARFLGRVVPLDATYAGTPFGWETRNVVTREEFAL